MDILNKMEQDFDDKFSNKLDFLVRNFGVISQKDLETDEEKYKEIIDLKLKELLHNFLQPVVLILLLALILISEYLIAL